MIPIDFQEYFSSCPSDEQELMVDELLQLCRISPEIADAPEEKRRLACPHCGSGSIVANGKLRGTQRYRCHGCGKNFSQTTGKVVYHLKKKDQLRRYLFSLLLGHSIRRSAKETGISVQTSFDWRHKLLSSFEQVDPSAFEGICEVDDMSFHLSEKGSRGLERPARKRGGKASSTGGSDQHVTVIVACDRSGNRSMTVSRLGRIGKKDLERALEGKLDQVEALCSDGHRSYGAFAKGQDIRHRKFTASKGQRVVDRVYHVQNVNNLDMRLRKFMASFNGVATKYLQNYLNWFLVLEKVKNSTNRIAGMMTLALASSQAWMNFKNIALNHILNRT